MATRYAIAAEFSIIDKATAQLNKMSGAGAVFGGAWKQSVAEAELRLSGLGKTIAGVGKAAVGLGVGTAVGGLAVATKQYADFDQAVRAAGAAYGPAFSQSADFESKLQDMGKAVRAVAAATEFDATQSANALQTLALAGVQSDQAIALLPGVADLATAAMTSMDDAVALAVGSLNVMGMMSDDPATLAANMTRISDVMTHTANSAYMSLQDASAAIGESGSFFRTTSNDLNVLSGSLTALAANNIKGAEAGTALRNVMTNLSAPTAGAEKALAAMGIQTKDAAGNLLSLPSIIGQFSKAMEGMGDAERNANLYAVFGKQNIAAVNALLNTGQTALEEYAAAAADSAGTVTANAEAIRGSLINKFKVLMSALTELGFKFVEAFAGKGGEAIDALTDAVSRFDPTPIVNALVTAVNAIVNVVKVAWSMRHVIGAVVAAVVAWRVATTATAAALIIKKNALAVINGAQIAYGIVVKKNIAAERAYTFMTGKARVATAMFTTVMKFFNATLFANPVLFFVGLIAAVIAAILILTNKWKGVSEAVDGFFERIRNMKGVGGMIVRFLVAPFEVLWKLLRGVLDVFAALKSGGIINAIKMLGLAILQSVVAPIQKTVEMLSWIPGLGDWMNEKMGELQGWIDETRAGLLSGKEEEEESPAGAATGLPAAAPDVAPPPPTTTAAAANSYSREEKTTTNRLEVGLAPGLEARSASKPAPAFTLYAGRG